MIKFAAFRPKRYSSLTDDSEENKKGKITNKWVEKKTLEFRDYKHCLELTEFENKRDHSEKYNLDVDNLKKPQKIKKKQ